MVRQAESAGRGRSRLVGALCSIGALQWMFCVMIAEGSHSGFTLGEGQWIPYSNQIHYVSELGLGSTALLFNISTIVLGLAIAAASVLRYLDSRTKLLPASMLLAGIGAAGVGVFPTDIQPTHGIFQLFALVFGALAAIFSYRSTRAPMSYVSVLLGVVSIGASIAFFPYLGAGVNDMSVFIGLRKGVMERLAIYPIVFWLIGYGYQLVHTTQSTGSSGSGPRGAV